MSGRYEGNLPCLNITNVQEKSFLSASEELHKSLGNVSYARLRQKLGIPLRNTTKCEACALGKITKASFKSKHQRAARPFEEPHLDLIGPISPTSRENDRYILTVVDSNTRYCSATPINLKSNHHAKFHVKTCQVTCSEIMGGGGLSLTRCLAEKGCKGMVICEV
ncbi:hypothetical protein VP01_9194g1 [Puccinia sorghi]|uniref:GAG-pre-integrase domain-containing protein n=1 Tax=Puccinia sorghi TaxID=27349 RepID=A0A0L6U7D4_9BASI|nr:hypothetical protein VP01_9194g1 [Puccinia sorghi]